ncbi:MAG: tetratricopeptide repeat protein [Promethearchaeota archaeon]
MMSNPRPEELIHAEEFIYNGKLDKALEIIANIEKKSDITPEEQLWSLLLRGLVYFYKQQFKKGVEMGEYAYQLSRELVMVPESIEALILKAQMVYLGKPDESLDLVSQAEEILNSLTKGTNFNLPKLKTFILIQKSWANYYKGDLTTALELALKGLKLAEKIDLDLNRFFFLKMLCFIYPLIGEHNIALDYANKSLKLAEEMNFRIGIAMGLWGIGIVYYVKGDLNKALKFCDKSLLVNEIDNMTKAGALVTVGGIYFEKGELDLALKSLTQAAQLSEESSNIVHTLVSLTETGRLYIKKGNYDQATKYLHRSLALSQETGVFINSIWTIFYLFLVNLENEYDQQALQYLDNLKKLTDLTPEQTPFYLLAKAMSLMKKRRTRDRAEAENLLKHIVEDETAANLMTYDLYLLSIVTFCDYLLRELAESNDAEILDELNPVIHHLILRAEEQNSFSGLAESNLLQAKLALLQMNIEGAKQFLTEAQRIAQEHSLNLLAQKISHEHDILLEKVGDWDKLKKKNAPMADRIELASFDGVINRLAGRQALDPPKVVDEEPILLLIMDNSGVTYFNHPFAPNWDHSDLFGLFMSALNNISDEIFAKSIDRIRIDENTILMQPVEPFLACYVIKGQSYPALQKLSRFTEAIRENSEIWQALNKSVKTSEMLELDKPPELKTVIDEIFT